MGLCKWEHSYRAGSWYGQYFFTKIDEKYNFVEFLNGMYRDKPSITYEAILEPGRYIVYLEVEWNQDFINQFILGNITLISKNLT